MATREEKIRVSVEGADKGARDIGTLDRATDQLGDEFRELGRDAAALDRQLDQLKRTQTGLAQAFARTRNADFLKQFKAAGREAGQIRQLQKALRGGGGLGGGGDLGSFDNLPAAIGRLGAFGPLAGVGGAAFSPMLGAGLAAGTLLGGGLAGVAGGAGLAISGSNDLQARFSGMGQRSLSVLQGTADPFVGPLSQVPDILEEGLKRISPKLKGIFAELAGEVTPLTRGLVGFVEEALPGLRRMMAAGASILREFSTELPDLGAALGDFAGSMADAEDGAKAFLRDFLVGSEKTIVALGNIIEFLAEIYEAGSKLPPWARGAWIQDIDKAKDGIEEIPPALDDVGEAADDAASDMRRFSDQLSKALGHALDAREASRRYQAAIDDLTESVRENGRSLDEREEKGRSNLDAVDTAIEAAERERQANIDNGMAIEQANTIYNQQIEELKRHATQLGLNKKEIDKLTAAAQAMPTSIGIGVHLTGVGAVGAALSGLKSQLNDIMGATYQGIGVRGNNPQPRAAGGPVTAGMPYIVGDGGRPELFVPNVSGRIEPRVPTTANGAGGAVSVSLVSSGVGNSAIASLIEHLVRIGDLQLRIEDNKVVAGAY